MIPLYSSEVLTIAYTNISLSIKTSTFSFSHSLTIQQAFSLKFLEELQACVGFAFPPVCIYICGVQWVPISRYIESWLMSLQELSQLFFNDLENLERSQ